MFLSSWNNGWMHRVWCLTAWLPLGRRRRWRANIDSALGRRLMFLAITEIITSDYITLLFEIVDIGLLSPNKSDLQHSLLLYCTTQQCSWKASCMDIRIWKLIVQALCRKRNWCKDIFIIISTVFTKCILAWSGLQYHWHIIVGQLFIGRIKKTR